MCGTVKLVENLFDIRNPHFARSDSDWALSHERAKLSRNIWVHENLPDLYSLGCRRSRQRHGRATLGQPWLSRGSFAISRKARLWPRNPIYPMSTTASGTRHLGWWPYPITRRFSRWTLRTFLRGSRCAVLTADPRFTIQHLGRWRHRTSIAAKLRLSNCRMSVSYTNFYRLTRPAEHSMDFAHARITGGTPSK